MRKVSPEGLLEPYFPNEEDPATRQGLPKAYALNGALYLTQAEALRRVRSFTPPKTYAYVMAREHSIDIDSPEDLRLSELLLEDRLRDAR
jgi:CMP-N-acetylneuraminic acid synthetase